MFLGVDIGGTTIKFAIIDKEYKIIHHEVCDTPDNISLRIEDEIYRVAKEIKENYNYNKIGISAAGVIDTNNMTVISAGPTIKNYIGTDFKKSVGDKLGVDIYVDNDVNCALLGEQWLGGAKGLDEVFCLALGTGIGGAYYLDKMPQGSCFGVGEIGKSLYDKATDTSYEQRASTIALENKVKSRLGEEVSVIEFFDRCKANDKEALELMEEWSTHLAEGIVNMLLILDPKCVILGGAVSKQGDYLVNIIENKVKELNPIKTNQTKFVVASLGNDAALYGAVSVFVEK